MFREEVFSSGYSMFSTHNYFLSKDAFDMNSLKVEEKDTGRRRMDSSVPMCVGEERVLNPLLPGAAQAMSKTQRLLSFSQRACSYFL